jgi:glycosyltransferase involved in cell wall biosynthesis
MADSGAYAPSPVEGVSGDRDRLIGRGRRVALAFGYLGAGGVERSMLTLAEQLRARDCQVDLVLARKVGDLLAEVPDGVRVIELARSSVWRTRAAALAADPAALIPLRLEKKLLKELRQLPSFADYLRGQQPAAVFAAMPRHNLQAVWARKLAGYKGRVIVSERDRASTHSDSDEEDRQTFPASLIRRAYMLADTIVAVADGVADDLAIDAGIPRDRIITVYNPVVGEELFAKAREPLDHPWFAPGQPPVILGVGRLHPQKDFPTLIRSFARVRARRPARLVILGAADQGRETYLNDLNALPLDLGVAEDVSLPGFVANPYAYMARAGVFVLSSFHEGLPGALIQALACGCPVVSTDCVSGPDEILEHGRYGPLVPVGDDAAMAAAIERTLDNPLPHEQLLARAQAFSVDRAVARYWDLMFGDDPASDG